MNILLLQLKMIGDAILTTPVMRCLRDEIPGCRITLAVRENVEGLLPLLDSDRNLVFRGGAGGRAFWRDFFGARYDVCLDFTGNDRSALLAALSRAEVRATYERFRKRPLRKTVFNRFVDSSVKERHTADHHTDLLRALGIERGGVPTELRVGGHRDVTLEKLARAGVGKPFAVIHAGTARSEKYWSAEAWARVADHLAKEWNLSVALTGTSDRREREHIAVLRAAAKCEPADLSGLFTLPELAAVMAESALVCGVDSAPIHLADAVGVPVVALFGPTDPKHWAPRSAGSLVVRPPGEKQGPMGAIASEAVIGAIGELGIRPPRSCGPETERTS